MAEHTLLGKTFTAFLLYNDAVSTTKFIRHGIRREYTSCVLEKVGVNQE